MNIVIWVLAGSLLGWIGYAYFGYNEARGVMVSALIGGAGGFLGGNLIAPMFGVAPTVPGDFSAAVLIFAAAVAVAFVFVGNFVHRRWGV
jgi:uncharacterized membrane protein YeaQ/YmgE (transglycosylase-associated protein family)